MSSSTAASAAAASLPSRHTSRVGGRRVHGHVTVSNDTDYTEQHDGEVPETPAHTDHDLDRLFQACDLDGSGYIDQDELASICQDLTGDVLGDVFKQLDNDGDGRISVEEFVKGYRDIVMRKETKKRQLIRQRLKSRSEENLADGEEPVPDSMEYASGLDEGLKGLSCQEQVCELYQNLHTADNPELLTQFENIVLNVIHDVRQYQLENERLEKTYQREKDEHLKHLRRLEEEMEQQVQSVEERVRRQEKEKLESEKVELRNVLDSEIIMLQQNLTKLQASGGSNLGKGQEEHLNNLKKRLEEIQGENRMLKSELTDAQTNLALTRSQMTSVKQKLEEKSHELEVENKTVEDYLAEQDKLRRQLQMLHEANKTLLDTNDNLRERLDSSPVVGQSYIRQGSTDFELGALYKSGHSAKSGRSPRCMDPGSPSFPRKGSVMSNYVDTHPGNRPPLLAFNTGMMPRFLNESCDEDALIEDLDSGHSTLRDINDVGEVNDDTEIDSISIQSDLRRGRRHKRHRAPLKTPEEEEDDSHDEMESDPENIVTRDINGFRVPDKPKRSPSAGSRGSNRSQRSLNREDSVMSHSSRSSRGSSRRQLPALPSAEVSEIVPAPAPAPPKDPDRVHRIYMAGDAAVGKTSFIFRICKGKFVPNLSSTLGMDFYTKMIDVDGNNTVMELWDTAGQERFRAMTRTYFRRADGVLLLYDVTYERSFLNVREWVNAIEEGAVKKLPIMLVGNKTDLRDEMEKAGRRVVRYEDGLRLSKEIDALFIETSAKDGSNITEACIELTRLLRTNQDLEVKSVGMQIHEMSSKKNSSCCSRS